MDWSLAAFILGSIVIVTVGIKVLIEPGSARKRKKTQALATEHASAERTTIEHTQPIGVSMSAWLREIAGWVLLGTGLAMFGVTYAVFLLNRRVVEAVLFGFAALAVFRGGLQLLKVAMAARASRDIRREIAATAAPIRKVRPQLGSQHPHGRPRKSVMPGPAER